MGLADQLTLVRVAAVPLVVAVYISDFKGHDWWATGQTAATIGGFAAAGAWNEHIAWWALLISLVLTWLSGLDYARVAPGLLRGCALAP
jgi:phosphatidylglycerophosphate synthase